ncbi:MAG: fibronectin type III domain-containing protein [Thermodesulfobacteriota bacterium]
MPEQSPRGLRLWSFLLVLLALGLAAACGKKEAPISPDLVLPAPVRDFGLSQDGESLLLRWGFPQVNQLGQPLTQLAGFRLYRCAAPGTSPAAGCVPDFVLLAEIDLAYPKVGRVQGDSVAYRDTNLTPGKCYSYRVAAYGPGDDLGAWSPVLSHAWGVLPRAPGVPTVKPGDREVHLAWPEVTALQNGAPLRDLAGYTVYRRTGQQAWQRLNPTPLVTTKYQDVAVQNEVEYTYKIRSVRRLGDYTLESLDSPGRTVTARDLTPPAPPLNLVAVPTARGVELRWEASPAPDLAGYRVYRVRAGEVSPALLTPQLVPQPYFVDTQARPGQTYYYAVTAVDNARPGNESQPSEEAAVGF